MGSGFEPLKAEPADLQSVALSTELKAPLSSKEVECKLDKMGRQIS